MKRMIIVFTVILLALTPVFAQATGSKENINIPRTTVIEVIPEDETEEVIEPTVEIIPDTEEVIELRQEMKTVFTLTINYVYVDGSEAAATYSTVLQTGSEYSVESPAISGFSASETVIAGSMPMRDVQFTVVYVSQEAEIPVFPYSEMTALYSLKDYETPLGLGFSVNNIGICFE